MKRFLTGMLKYGAIVASTLLLFDGAMMLLGLFPPRSNPGDPELGWRPRRATGRFETARCEENSTGETHTFQQNEDGIRTTMSRAAIDSNSGQLRIAVTGDSQTDLCAPDAQTHGGVLQSELTSRGVPATVLAYGAGRYSPLQDYLAFRTILRPYHPKVLVINVYTGNDFYDILRVDDRPHFVPSDTGYAIAPPVWYLLDEPGTQRSSRVLFALRSLAEKTGIRGFTVRVTELRQHAVAHGGICKVLSYMKDLWRSSERTVGYPAAFAAQILNQQLFFYHFEASRAESIRRLEALLALARRENPEVILVLSPLPSYQLVGQRPVDEALLRTVARLPISYEAGVRQETDFYELLRSLAARDGWVFVDNLAALREYRGNERLYNGFDYHFRPVASAIIGKAQAAALFPRVVPGEERPMTNRFSDTMPLSQPE